MEFVSLGAMVVALRGVVVDDFPIQIAKMKIRTIQGYAFFYKTTEQRTTRYRGRVNPLSSTANSSASWT